MKKINLKFQYVQTMAGTQDVGLIVLTDEQETRQINVFCDGYTRLQFMVRTNQMTPDQIRFRTEEPEADEELFGNNIPEEEEINGSNDLAGQEANKTPVHYLPEVLVSIMQYLSNIHLEACIYNVYGGEYRAVLIDSTTGTSFAVRACDAVLLHVVNNHIPLTCDANLWQHQSVPFSKDMTGVSLPINTLSVPMLKAALKKAIDDERYEAAQQLKNELERRK